MEATQDTADQGPAFRWSTGRVYAISFDLDVVKLEQHHPSHNRTAAYDDIRRIFERRGFRSVQGSMYFGGKNPRRLLPGRPGCREQLSVVEVGCQGYPHAAG